MMDLSNDRIDVKISDDRTLVSEKDGSRITVKVSEKGFNMIRRHFDGGDVDGARFIAGMEMYDIASQDD